MNGQTFPSNPHEEKATHPPTQAKEQQVYGCTLSLFLFCLESAKKKQVCGYTLRLLTTLLMILKFVNYLTVFFCQ